MNAKKAYCLIEVKCFSYLKAKRRLLTIEDHQIGLIFKFTENEVFESFYHTELYKSITYITANKF